ncbi:MAG: hypothetical protein HY435_02170 [Candidatus Liptonbacteria bacterium]|nr:hypothetical protein [Candidatus Liptonbacteria bacterium]
MSDHGTLSSGVPGWYIQFQADILLQLPRPGEVSEDIALWWHGNRGAMKNALRKALLPQEEKRATEAAPLLISVGTATVAATTTPFVARDRFVVNVRKTAPVEISRLGDNFKVWFLGKEEQPFGGSTLKYGKLSRSSVNESIIAALGSEKVETTLAELFALMTAQKHCERGPLLTNGLWNIFYIKDDSRVLCAVYVAGWGGHGWSVDANSIASPSAWAADVQVLSRNS